MKKSDCIFCQIPVNGLSEFILYEGNVFRVIHDGFPIASPHFLIIPKEHTDSYHSVSIDDFTELNKIIALFSTKIADRKYMLFEHGKLGQTVKHAHMHMLPALIPLDTLISELHVDGEVVEIKNMSDLTMHDEYLFLSSEGKNVVLLPHTTQIEPGIITNTLARLLNVPFPASNRRQIQSNEIQQYKEMI